jgi:hypothetical protein
LIWILACNLATPSTTPSTPTATSIANGSVVTLNNVSMTIPQGLAKDALSEMVSASTDSNAPPWDIAPEHLRFIFTSYPLQDKFLQPQVIVYPANEYAQLVPNVADNILRLKEIAAGGPLSEDNLSQAPFFNAQQLIAAQLKVINLQNGSGYRAVMQYAQYPATINNYELIYHFEGLTTDGNYYVVAILPINAPILAETDKPDAVIPTGGVPVPAEAVPNEVYYSEVTDKLNMLSPDEFTPSLNLLDSLIQSISVTTP